MKLEEIMKDKKRLNSGTLFKQRNKPYCVKWSEEYGFIEIISYEEDNKVERAYKFTPNDFIVNDWEWVEKWYKGDFKKKYPNGVVVMAWNDKSQEKYKTIMINYIPNTSFPFWTVGEISWKYAEPVKPEDAPAIIGGKDEL